MKREYEKETIIKDKTDKEKKIELLGSIEKTKEDLRVAINNYEYAEGNLIDYFLYQIKANQAKLDYLIKSAKKLNIELNIRDTMDLKSKKVI